MRKEISGGEEGSFPRPASLWGLRASAHLQVWDCNKPAPERLGRGFNLVVASNAIHTCADMSAALRHTSDILADDGFLLCYEMTVRQPGSPCK